LLLVFATAELPDAASHRERTDFAQGLGGALMPAICVDMALAELSSFAALKQEAEQYEQAWRILFASTMSANASQTASNQAVESNLRRMVESIKLGMFANMIAFDTQGHAVAIGASACE
jgi:hypothetical protein